MLVSMFPQGLTQGSSDGVRDTQDAAMTPSLPLTSTSSCLALGWLNQEAILHRRWARAQREGDHGQNTALESRHLGPLCYFPLVS